MSPQFKSLLGFVARTTAALVLTISLGIGTLYAQEHYTWVADDDGSWQDPDNWFPRGVPGIEAEDFVIFDHDGNFTITELPHGIVLRGMEVKGTGTTILMAETPNTEIYMGVDDPNPVFRVHKSANLMIMGGNSTRWIMTPGRRGLIEGGLILAGSSQATNHMFTLSEANTLTFASGSLCMIGGVGTRYSGFPFGSNGANNAAIFQAGSKLIHNDGSDPFGQAGFNKITMQSGSIYEFASPYESVIPVMMGRKFGHFHYTSAFSRVITGAGNVDVEDFKIASAGLTLRFLSGNNIVYMRGDMQIPNVDANPNNISVRVEANSGTVIFFISKPQATIVGNSTLFIAPRARIVIPSNTELQVKCNIEVSQTPLANTSFGILEMQRDARLYMHGEYHVRGTGRFVMNTNCTLGIGSANGINIAPSEAGNIRTTVRQYMFTGRYVYFGNTDQVPGNALPVYTGMAPAPIVEVNKGGESKLTITANLVAGALHMEAGTLDLGNFRLRMLAGQDGVTSATVPAVLSSGRQSAAIITSGSNASIDWEGAGTVAAQGELKMGNTRLLTGKGSGVDFGSTGQPTLIGELRINTNTQVINNAPFYAPSSKLMYAVTGSSYYNVGAEWALNASQGRGVPHNIQVGMPGVSGTLLSLGTQPGARHCTGLMRVGHPGANLTYGLQIPKNVELVLNTQAR